MENKEQVEITNEVREAFKELAELSANLKETGKIVKKLEERESELKRIITEWADRVDLEEIKLENIRVKRSNESSISLIKEREEKESFYEYLKSKDLFYDLLTVNSQTLNSWYKKEEEIALENGVLEFQIPGVKVSYYVKTKINLEKK